VLHALATRRSVGGFFKLNKPIDMTPNISNDIILVEARIKQFQESELYTLEEKEIKIKPLKIELERLHLQYLNKIDVINPEIVS